MQVQGPDRLGGEDLFELRLGQVDEGAVSEDGSRVKDPAQRMRPFAQTGERAAHLTLVRDVRLHRAHLGAAKAQLLQRLFRLGGRRAAPRSSK